MKKKILISPLLIIVLIAVVGVGVAGAAVYFGGSGVSGEVSLQKGLVGWWKLDGNARDATSNTNNGAITAASSTTDRKGQSSKAYDFDGSTAYISKGTTNLLKNVAAATLTAWVRK
ncbi:MAG: hypothetical protein Q7R33_06975, partial [Nitrosarchaeum sp.]|nr:hypothetical protein [Nitrosarchaeum sp.]